MSSPNSDHLGPPSLNGIADSDELPELTGEHFQNTMQEASNMAAERQRLADRQTTIENAQQATQAKLNEAFEQSGRAPKFAASFADIDPVILIGPRSNLLYEVVGVEIPNPNGLVKGIAPDKRLFVTKIKGNKGYKQESYTGRERRERADRKAIEEAEVARKRAAVEAKELAEARIKSARESLQAQLASLDEQSEALAKDDDADAAGSGGLGAKGKPKGKAQGKKIDKKKAGGSDGSSVVNAEGAVSDGGNKLGWPAVVIDDIGDFLVDENGYKELRNNQKHVLASIKAAIEGGPPDNTRPGYIPQGWCCKGISGSYDL